MAEHRLVLGRQLATLSGTDDRDPRLRRRLTRLVTKELIIRENAHGETHYRILKPGLTAIGNALPVPSDTLSHYWHDVGLAWLWLAGHGGAFGPLSEVVGERRLRAADRAGEHPDNPYGVRLGGLDQYGNESLHYPDLLLIDRHGRRLALELELTQKARAKLDPILGGYAADPRIDHVLYLVEANSSGRGIRRAIEETVRDIKLSDRVWFQFIDQLKMRSSKGPRAPARAVRSEAHAQPPIRAASARGRAEATR